MPGRCWKKSWNWPAAEKSWFDSIRSLWQIHAAAMIRVRRAYEAPEADDGVRILVDRLWPRGLSKETARVDLWLKDAAPSDGLRRWFAHEPAKWEEFRQRYFAELERKPDTLAMIRRRAAEGTVTLLFGAKETRFNHAVALADYLAGRFSDRGV